ncbi:transposase [Nonomuraea wenchangensis]
MARSFETILRRANRAPRAGAAAQHRHTAQKAGDGGGDAEHWPAALTELKNRGVDDGLMPVCDGPKGLPQAAEAVRPPHDRADDLRDSPAGYSYRYAARQDWPKIARALKPCGEAPLPASSARKADDATPDFVHFVALASLRHL